LVITIAFSVTALKLTLLVCWTLRQTGTPRDTLAPYPWSHSVKSGVWLRALENGDQCRPMDRNFTFYVFYVY